MFTDKDFEEYVGDLEHNRSYLEIDKYDLENECMRQASLYERIGQMTSELKSEQRKAKDALDFTKSRIKSDARSNPDAYALKKTTNDAIEDAIVCTKEYREAAEYYYEIQAITESFSILLNAVEQRKAMLRELVSLFVHNYYTADKLTNEQKQLQDNTQDRIQDMRRRSHDERNEEEYDSPAGKG